LHLPNVYWEIALKLPILALFALLGYWLIGVRNTPS
jgi:hypothetical protein